MSETKQELKSYLPNNEKGKGLSEFIDNDISDRDAEIALNLLIKYSECGDRHLILDMTYNNNGDFSIKTYFGATYAK